MRIDRYNLIVRDSLIDPYEKDPDKQYGCFKKPVKSDRPLYKVWIYLEGKDLPFVESVKYILHRTFNDPVKVVEKSANNPNFSLVIWTWGIFKINVEIKDIRGKVIKMEHRLTYGEQLKQGKISLKDRGY